MGSLRQLEVGLVIPSGIDCDRWHHALIFSLDTIPGVHLFLMECQIPESSLTSLWRRLVRDRQSRPELLDNAPAANTKKITPLSSGKLPEGRYFDTVIDLSGQIESGWQNIGSFGLWRLFDGAGRPFDLPFPGVESITKGKNAEICLVQKQQKSALVRRRSRFLAGPGYANSLSRQFDLAVQLVRQALIDATNAFNPVESYSANLRAPLPFHKVVRCLVQGTFRAAFARIHRVFFAESWMVGLIETDIGNLLTAPLPLKIRWLGNRESHSYFADPFGIPGSLDRMYCEHLDQDTNLGTIKELRITGDALTLVGDISFPGNGHLSYPYLFSDNGQEFCLPEAGASGHCTLYCKDGSGGWQVVAVLLEGVVASDPSIFRWQDRYWLAYTDDTQGPFDNLCLAYADELAGPWVEHANNPVKRDLRSSRSAGVPFMVDGNLYRPTQDCDRCYGASVAICRVEVCTPTAFREELVRVLPPDISGPNPHGFHTISAWGGQVLVDGKRHVLNPFVLARKILRRLTPLRSRIDLNRSTIGGTTTVPHAMYELLSHMTYIDDESDRMNLLEKLCNPRKPTVLSFLNQHGFNLAWDSPKFLSALQESDLLLRDGIGMTAVLKCIGRLPGLNLNGTDLIPDIVTRFAQRRVMLIGTTEPYLGRAAAILRAKGCNIVGTMDGFAADSTYIELVKRIRPELVILGMGMPKQERVALQLSAALDFPVLIVNGGAIFDFLSGRFSRAPALMRHMRLEWAYRLLLEPRRMWRRYILGGAVFAARILRLRASRANGGWAASERSDSMKG